MEDVNQIDHRIRIEPADMGDFYIAEIKVASTPIGDIWELHGYFVEPDRAFKSALVALDG